MYDGNRAAGRAARQPKTDTARLYEGEQMRVCKGFAGYGFALKGLNPEVYHSEKKISVRS
jgi:hypothetical protein